MTIILNIRYRINFLSFLSNFYAISRIYNINDPHIVIQSHNLSGSDCVTGNHRASMGAHELGERAVAFDYGPGEESSYSPACSTDKHCDMRWPVYILWGNGDVYILYTSLK